MYELRRIQEQALIRNNFSVMALLTVFAFTLAEPYANMKIIQS